MGILSSDSSQAREAEETLIRLGREQQLKEKVKSSIASALKQYINNPSNVELVKSCNRILATIEA